MMSKVERRLMIGWMMREDAVRRGADPSTIQELLLLAADKEGGELQTTFNWLMDEAEETLFSPK